MDIFKVKLFDEDHEKDLEEVMNEFLADIPEHRVKEIKYQVAVGNGKDGEVYCFSGMVVYKTGE